MSSQTPLVALSPELQILLKEHNESLLNNIINTNLQTRFVQEYDGLREFRDAIELLKDRSAHEAWECYRDSIPITDYSAYDPFISRFLEEPCKEEDVKDLLSPGLPVYLALSSGTSGKAAKLFPKYHHVFDAASLPFFITLSSGTSGKAAKLFPKDHHSFDAAQIQKSVTPKGCQILPMTYFQAIDVFRNEGKSAKVIITTDTSGLMRLQHGLTIEKDLEMIKMTLPNTTSPIAIGHIRNYRSYLLMHALFALAEEKLTSFCAVFSTLFLDLIMYMEEEWPTLLNSVENGTIPEFEDMNHVREYLEPKLLPNPARAQKLWEIGKSKAAPGWLFRIWPELEQVICIVTGVFATTLPKLQYYLGPEVLINSGGVGASEGSIGVSYSFTDLNLFKVATKEFIEYLDITKDPSPANLVPAWELETGRRYEIFLTTRNGLWRYCLGDIIEVAGFDPDGGFPLLRYVERSNRDLRLSAGVSITETQLIEGILAGEKSLGKVKEFTVVIDERAPLRRFGYFVELHDALTPNAYLALHEVRDELRRINENVDLRLSDRTIGDPTIRILRPGTFSEYRQWRIGITKTAAGQTKVPVFVTDEATKEWLKEKVIHELSYTAEG
ncbi:GH3 auxin-responsive promoter-domain-containing protein [Hygrophoropsis aurantiaca]|uniref:GH3 auxin-responsive promoter-domain-containing protein n=1 Tax=Hygrophoropsis aurantiaca TaxID=72124 RepID=A0ACB8AD87_9AGAM|nr:GH3 auxin-responsive promoter-domain-containing protein [Hygrophoropsis aurantiaca]